MYLAEHGHQGANIIKLGDATHYICLHAIHREYSIKNRAIKITSCPFYDESDGIYNKNSEKKYEIARRNTLF